MLSRAMELELDLANVLAILAMVVFYVTNAAMGILKSVEPSLRFNVMVF